MTTVAVPELASDEDLIEKYVAAVERAGLGSDSARHAARMFLRTVGDIDRWQSLPVEAKCAFHCGSVGSSRGCS
jgi:hypothetical protein